MIGHLILRLTLWLLLTNDRSLINIAIGLAIALLLPRSYTSRGTLRDVLRMLQKILVAVPMAYVEAFEMIVRPHNHEDVVMERVPVGRSRRLVFLDVFLITFTPKTIVLNYHEADRCYEVHRVRKRPSP